MHFNISICIPVYNCANFLKHALDSILAQSDMQHEIIVYDGGSTDNTPAIMEQFVRNWSNLRYFRNTQRGGIDADLDKCVSLSKGEYCWLFSGDDVMRPGALKKVDELIKSNHDLYICKHTICNINMKFMYEYPVFKPDIPALVLPQVHVDT